MNRSAAKTSAKGLSTFARQVFAGTPIKLELSLAKGPCPLPSHTRSQLLRIGKEALSNALKHARPSKVCVELAYLDEEVRLEVGDDGKGFKAGLASNGRQGFGLCGMRARATDVGGTVTVRHFSASAYSCADWCTNPVSRSTAA